MDELSSSKIGFIYSPKNKMLFFYLTELLKNTELDEGLEFICFSLADINFNLMTVGATIVNKDGLCNKQTNVPNLIFNLVYHTKSDSIKAMRKLRTTDGYRVVNPTNRFNQSVIFDIIKSFPQSEQVLLPFCSLTKKNLMNQLENSDTLYILPERGLSAQNVVCIQLLDNENVKISVGINNNFCSKANLYDTLLKMTMGKKYMSMQGIKLIKQNGFPLEARLYVQKNERGLWKITGGIAKHEFFTYGSSYNNKSEDLSFTLFEESPEIAHEVLLEAINTTTTLCSFLDYYVIDMGSLIFDYIISDSGNIYLLYLGGCEQNFSKMSRELEHEYYFNIQKYMLALLEEHQYIGADE